MIHPIALYRRIKIETCETMMAFQEYNAWISFYAITEETDRLRMTASGFTMLSFLYYFTPPIANWSPVFTDLFPEK